ncbi:hypothetical protein JK359_08230 [Streptomyces actinomycinicus]|uniref:Protein phosphatase 2C domain-containing protein n=1 Tax=Streptomyces actinomycinicus TaxID=1695166 RepID=A0A937JM56_9ACTN|nr:hypothetical protein [Streptomyces actinomycinicus]MBL1081971.1 hypothetical protein [Streptomyces actinomycinicus]
MEDVAALLECQQLRIHKAGSSPEECEDAERVWSGETRPDGRGNTVVPLYAAVSDGASESLLAGAWADRLVADAVDCLSGAHDWWDDLGGFVEELMTRSAGRWAAHLAQYRAEREARGRPITWYEQPGLAKGAFATLLGAEVRATVSDTGACSWAWHAFALGDSCLFQLRDGALVRAFPVESAEDFGVTPQLLGSRNHDTALVTDRLAVAHGTLEPGDEILLATDALAAWLLSPRHGGVAPGHQLAMVLERDQESFPEWVDDQRARGHMRNDDVTLIRMKVRAEA